jgi:hypothetical protein
MILAPIVGVGMVIAITTGPVLDMEPAHISNAQRVAAVQPLIQVATDCIARAVIANPRYRSTPEALGDLIVDSVPSCIKPVRAMIDAYDRYFGDGSGEVFFMGPYLDVLPKAVIKRATDLSASQ